MKRNAFELMRYGINGLFATGVHYSVLTFNMEVLAFSSAGLANSLAAVFGIGASYFGSRYFVFPGTTEHILKQAVKFSGLYAVIAIFHGLILLVWSDAYGLDYRVGFLIATAVQVSLSYMGNKFLVFKV